MAGWPFFADAVATEDCRASPETRRVPSFPYLAGPAPERALVESVRLRQAPVGLREEEAADCGYTRQLLEHRKVDAALYERGKVLLEIVGIVELTALVGYYTFIALTLDARMRCRYRQECSRL